MRGSEASGLASKRAAGRTMKNALRPAELCSPYCMAAGYCAMYLPTGMEAPMQTAPSVELTACQLYSTSLEGTRSAKTRVVHSHWEWVQGPGHRTMLQTPRQPASPYPGNRIKRVPRSTAPLTGHISHHLCQVVNHTILPGLAVVGQVLAAVTKQKRQVVRSHPGLVEPLQPSWPLD